MSRVKRRNLSNLYQIQVSKTLLIVVYMTILVIFDTLSHDPLQDHTHMIILTKYQNHDPWHQKCCKTHLRSQSLHLPIRGHREKNVLSTCTGGRGAWFFFLGFQHLKDPNGEVSQKLEDKKRKTTFWDHKIDWENMLEPCFEF